MHLSSIYFFLGAPDRCLEVCETAVELPEVQGSPFFWLILLNLSSSHLDAGRPQRAVTIARRALEGAENPHSRAYAHSHLAEALQALGRFDEAEKHYHSSIESLERLGFFRDAPGIVAKLAELQLQARRVSLAEILAQDALKQMEELSADEWWKPCAFFTLGGTALARDDLGAAEEMLNSSAFSAESILPAVGSFSAELHQRIADLRHRQGRAEDARASLQAAAGIWRRLGGGQHPRLTALGETWRERGILVH
jgi:tetratricopeptide (TPR) repeat protein